MFIEVTQDDIKKGTRSDPCNCPIARAVKRANPDATYVHVGGLIQVDGLTYEYTPSAVKFIEDFDFGDPVQPFSFETPLIEELDW